MTDHTVVRSRLAATMGALGLARLDDRRSRSAIVVSAALFATRLALVAAILYAVDVEHARATSGMQRLAGNRALFIALFRWDAAWYLSIATKGVLFDPSGASNVAFLPAYPALTALVDLVVRNVGASSLLVSNIAFVAGVFVFRRWMQNRVGLGAADRSTVCLILYPLSFFFDTGYAESLFFLLCTLALERADREDWTAAGICASLATLTRPHGILLLPAFAYGFARGRRTAGVPWSALAALAMPIAALAAYFVYLWIAVGTPLAVIEAQRAGWHVRPSWYFMEWHAAKHVVGAVLNVFQLVLPVPLAALSLLAWRKLGPLAGVYSVLAVTAAVVFGADSLGREALAVVPVFAAAGLVQLPRPVLAACGVAGFALLVTFTYAFAMGQFMG